MAVDAFLGEGRGILHCRYPPAAQEEEEWAVRKAERDGAALRAPGPGSFPLISSVTRHPAAGLLADNYLAPCEEGKRETVCPQGLESPPHPSTHLGKATKKKIYR